MRPQEPDPPPSAPRAPLSPRSRPSALPPTFNSRGRRSSSTSAGGAPVDDELPVFGSPASALRLQLPSPPLAPSSPSWHIHENSHQHAPRRRSSVALSLRSFATVTRSPLPSPPLSPHPSGPAPLSPSEPSSEASSRPEKPSATTSEPSPYIGSGSDVDPFIVCFEQGDAADPRNWRTGYRWFIMICAALEMTGGTLAISIFTPGFGQMRAEFGVEREVVVVGTTLYLLGLAISSLITAPLGELFGRKPVVAVSFFLFTVTSMGVALAPNVGALLALRFISGWFGSASMSHGPAMASDLFSPAEIALPLTLAGVGRFGGPVLGPLIGGWINERVGWRWLAWVMTAFSGALTLLAAFAVPETYAPAILRKRARALAESLGASHVTTYDAGRAIGDWKDECRLYLFRPFLFLTREPIVLLLSLHVSFLYGILNLYFSAYPFVFTTLRGWSQGRAGLPFIAILIGFVLAIPIALRLGRVYTDAAARSTTGKAAPEERLWFGILGAGLLPISLFWLGWTARPGVHWMAPVTSGLLFSIGQLGLTQSVFTYFSDTYTYQMGSVLAGSNFMRFAFGGVFPLFSAQMFQKLGAGWACTLLGLLCVVFFPAPVIFYVYGARIRKWSKYVPAPLDGTNSDSEKGLATSATPSASNLAGTRTASPEALSRPPSPIRVAAPPVPLAIVSPPPSPSPFALARARRHSSRSSSSSIFEEEDDPEDGAMSRLSSRRGTTRRPSVVQEVAERPQPPVQEP